LFRLTLFQVNAGKYVENPSTTYDDSDVMGTSEAKFDVKRRRLPIFRQEERPVVPDPSGVIAQSGVLVEKVVVET
jgi:hypothetical protein